MAPLALSSGVLDHHRHERQLAIGGQNKLPPLGRPAPREEMLRRQVVTPRDVGDCARREGLRHNRSFLLRRPTTTSAASSQLKPPRFHVLEHMVDHICEYWSPSSAL